MDKEDDIVCIKDDKTLIDRIRLKVLTSAELFDAWRVVPRILVAAYGWMCWEIVDWYMDLKPAIIEGCDVSALGDLCLYDAPTTQHAALVTVIVGASAAVFGLYTNTGRSWTTGGFVKWDDTHTQTQNRQRYEIPAQQQYNQTRGRSRRQGRNSNRDSQQYGPSQPQQYDGFDDTQPMNDLGEMAGGDDEGFWN